MKCLQNERNNKQSLGEIADSREKTSYGAAVIYIVIYMHCVSLKRTINKVSKDVLLQGPPRGNVVV